MRKANVKVVAWALAGSLSMAAAAVAWAATPEEIIQTRREGYKQMGDNFKAMKEAVDSGADVKPLAPRAAAILAWAQKIPSMFPPGTETGGGTHAKPEIWTDRAAFDQRQQDLVKAAEKLQAAAESGDRAAFKAQFAATGEVCYACHQRFRTKL